MYYSLQKEPEYIGVGRLRILGAGGGEGLEYWRGQGLEYWGGGGARFRILGGQGGGANSQQAHDVVTTSMRRNVVASTSF